MQYKLSDSIRIIPGIGPTAQANLKRLNITTLQDFLAWYPREYIDGSNPLPIAALPLDKVVAVRAKVISCKNRPLKNRHMTMVEAEVMDDTGELHMRWFNQKFLPTKLVPESEWTFIGSVERFQGKLVMLSPIIEEKSAILAVYSQTEGITSKQIRSYLDWVLKHVVLDGWDIPKAIREKEGITSMDDAMRKIHQPGTMPDVEIGRKYVAFREVFDFFCGTKVSADKTHKSQGRIIPADTEYLHELVTSLPFSLTKGQKLALWEVAQDMAIGKPMTRLLNGDVGSGKTVVAALAAALVKKAGFQTVILVPTEILAKQHQESISRLLAAQNIKVSLWTAAQKDELEGVDIIVGTHAVLQEAFSLTRLGLLVIDEQHRFGVRQRQLLRQQSEVLPHVLSMTATPIPRTLALALFGDLSMSMIKEKPADRLPIKTEIIYERQRPLMQERILIEINQGNQVFVVCPLIEEKASESPDEATFANQEKKTVLAEVVRLRRENPEFGEIEVIHGKMKAEEKRRIMSAMSEGKINLLVATSVVEVGVDIPRATVMVVEGAERFGLAQLHQLRGRVGRNGSQAYCFLCPGLRSQSISQRLETLVEYQSGFDIAEQDLQLRGPGDVTGFLQSGLPDFRMASLTDVDFLQHIKEVADTYITSHPEVIQEWAKMEYSSLMVGLE